VKQQISVNKNLILVIVDRERQIDVPFVHRHTFYKQTHL